MENKEKIKILKKCMKTNNKQKILIKLVNVQKLIIDNDYNTSLNELDTVICQIRCMTDKNCCTLPENARKGGV